MYKIAVMGDWDSIYGFGALGLDTFRIEEGQTEEAVRVMRSLAEQNYAIIYVTEALAAAIPAEIDRYRTMARPAVILIPGISGNTGEGVLAVRKSVEQAVGSDIIFNK
ncbi:MAG: V-type ATP synthase subunit F [Lachnospiraceae bacterium]|nr:V-type ATP synthase subunit F [Lachnospiraceae bacterium]MBQ9644476.1 V-type ATP synthase subunit F [Lachnospiraceae bacterium]